MKGYAEGNDHDRGDTCCPFGHEAEVRQQQT
jgi:hypothetical protein